MVTGFGLVSHLVRYYRPLPAVTAPREGLHGFFWLRREKQLPWRVVQKLIENATFDSFHIHLAVDPGTPAPELPKKSPKAVLDVKKPTATRDTSLSPTK